MTRGGCASNVTNALKPVPGVGGVNISLQTGGASVEYDEDLISPDRLKAAVRDGGYGVGEVHLVEGKRGCCG